MSVFLGIDTSNYTTSCALYDSDSGTVKSCKRLLPVKSGERGIRQSGAVFHHIKQIPLIMKELFEERLSEELIAAAYSFAPRLVEGSYMPCFLVGEGVAESICAAMGIEAFRTSHQIGHILAALFSCGRLDFLKADKPFLAFHVSGGTTDLLLCRPDKENVLSVTEIGRSLDLKAGQCVDRLGVRMGLSFPCGAQLEKLALKSDKVYKIKPTLKGLDCSLSGVENKYIKMLDNGESPEDTARFCIDYILQTLHAMTKAAIEKFGEMPIVFAGGVMADTIIKNALSDSFDCFFAAPEFSTDNAVGPAVYAAAVKGMI